jgi:hypothetical protein
MAILMTRLPGRELGQVYEDDRPFKVQNLFIQYQRMESAEGPERICNLTGGPIQSIRVPNHTVGSCDTSPDFQIISSPLLTILSGQEVFNSKLHLAKDLETLQAQCPGVKSTCGGTKHYNFLVDDIGHIRDFGLVSRFPGIDYSYKVGAEGFLVVWFSD